MNRTIARVLTVAALAFGGVAAGAAFAAPAMASKCYVNGVVAPCPKADYENDCEGVLQRPDCNAPAEEAPVAKAPASDPTNDSVTSGGGAAKAPTKKQPKAVTTTGGSDSKKSTTTQKGQTVTTVTVDESTGAVTITNENAQDYNDKMGMSRYGAANSI